MNMPRSSFFRILLMHVESHAVAETVIRVPMVYFMTGRSRFGDSNRSETVVSGINDESSIAMKEIHTGNICQRKSHDSRPENVDQ